MWKALRILATICGDSIQNMWHVESSADLCDDLQRFHYEASERGNLRVRLQTGKIRWKSVELGLARTRRCALLRS